MEYRADIPYPRPSFHDQVNDPETYPYEGLLGRINITGHEGSRLLAVVDPSFIYTEDFPVDEQHVFDLQTSMEQELAKGESSTGQLQHILLGHIPGLERFPIIDGFHRAVALKRLGRLVLAMIYPNTTWEEVLSKRIVAAASHESVRFSRIVAWAMASWKLTEWAQPTSKRNGITARQAFSLGYSKGMSGSKLGLTAEEATAIKEWIGRSSKEWGISARTIEGHLAAAEAVDPVLVPLAREAKARGNALRGKTAQLTPEHLRVLQATIPGEKNYNLQHAILAHSLEANLTTRQMRVLIEDFVATVDSGTPEDEAIQNIPSIVESLLNDRVARRAGGSRSPRRRLQRQEGDSPKEPLQHNTAALKVIYENEIALAVHSVHEAVRTLTRTENARQQLFMSILAQADPQVSAFIVSNNLYPKLHIQAQAASTPDPERILEVLALPFMMRRRFVLRVFFNMSYETIDKILGATAEATA